MNKFEEIRQNEPAFPTENARQTGENDYRYSGLTKREYFAAMALSGLIGEFGINDCRSAKEIAKHSIECADEMLRQLGE